MTSAGESLQATALVLEEDIRKIDAGETKASPEQRAFLVGAVRGLKVPGGTESGGLSVDSVGEGHSGHSASPASQGADGGRPENFDLAVLTATTDVQMPVTTTAPAAGAAGALPATPAGYMQILVNGTTRNVPYY